MGKVNEKHVILVNGILGTKTHHVKVTQDNPFCLTCRKWVKEAHGTVSDALKENEKFRKRQGNA